MANTLNLQLLNITPNPSIPPSDGSCPWSRVPKELRLVIHELAQDTSGPTRIKFGWVRRQERDCDVAIARNRGMPLPEQEEFTPAISKYLVNRQWMREALQALFHCMHYEATLDASFFTVSLTDCAPQRPQGIEFLRTMTIDFATLRNQAYRIRCDCLGLQNLYIKISTYQMEGLLGYGEEGRVAWFDHWTVELLGDNSWFRRLRRLSGLKRVSMTLIDDPGDFRAPEEAQTLRDNALMAEFVLARSLLRPRESPANPALTSSPRQSWKTVSEAYFRNMIERHPEDAVTWMVEAQGYIDGRRGVMFDSD